MATTQDSTIVYQVTDGNSSGSLHSRLNEPWAFNGQTPSIVRDSSANADSTASAYTLVNSLKAALIEKGIVK
jgi:hypothetical protein